MPLTISGDNFFSTRWKIECRVFLSVSKAAFCNFPRLISPLSVILLVMSFVSYTVVCSQFPLSLTFCFVLALESRPSGASDYTNHPVRIAYYQLAFKCSLKGLIFWITFFVNFLLLWLLGTRLWTTLFQNATAFITRISIVQFLARVSSRKSSKPSLTNWERSRNTEECNLVVPPMISRFLSHNPSSAHLIITQKRAWCIPISLKPSAEFGTNVN